MPDTVLSRPRSDHRRDQARNQATASTFSSLMTEQAEGRYFARREQSERTMSRLAKSERAAAAHWTLAEHYEALAVVFGGKNQG